MKFKPRYEKVEEGLFAVACMLGFVALLHITIEMIAWLT